MKEELEGYLGADFSVSPFLGRIRLDVNPHLKFIDNTIENKKLKLNLMYYFKSDMDGLYLILKIPYLNNVKKMYGRYYSTFLRNKSYYVTEFLKENYNLRDDLVFDINLGNERIKAKLHNKATIVAKFYDKNNIPSTEDLVSDILYFANLRKFILNNYTDQTEISKDEWISVLENESVIDNKMFNILRIMYNMEDYKATTAQLINKKEELGFLDEKTYNNIIRVNCQRINEFLNKEPFYNIDGSENYWMRFFYGSDVKTDKLDIYGKKIRVFQFKLTDELVNALDRDNRINKNGIIEEGLKEKIEQSEELDWDKSTEELEYESFYEYLNSKGFMFDKETIENYLLSLKVKPFAILTGNSGTGKTKLSQLFAKFIYERNIFKKKNIGTTKDIDSEYITFKTNDVRINEKFFGLSKKTICALLKGVEKYEGTIDVSFNEIESTEQIYLSLLAGSSDQKLLEHLNSLDDFSDIEIKISKKDLKNTFLNNLNRNKKDVISFERKKGEMNLWCLPKKQLHHFLPIKNKYSWNAIVDGIETTIQFWVHDVEITLISPEDGDLREYINQKDKDDIFHIKVDLNSFKSFNNEVSSDINFLSGSSNSELENYKIIPVGANWTENRNIVGYYNVITDEYQATPAYDLIKQAEDNDEAHFLILDEMNLSHVERYFADFLSAIESGEKIPLYGQEPLVLPSNLFIIGTVNVDETTYMFSPKVLDRANVLEFEVPSAKDYILGKIKNDAPSGDISYLEDPLKDSEIREYDIDELYEILKDVESNGENFWEILSNELDEFQEILKSSGFEFGFRVINEIIRFMIVAWRYEGEPSDWTNWERYFDAQIKQKILPKLHGSEKIIGDTLSKLYQKCLESAFNSEETAKYPKSAKKIKEMIDVLKKQRYVSFIN